MLLPLALLLLAATAAVLLIDRQIRLETEYELLLLSLGSTYQNSIPDSRFPPDFDTHNGGSINATPIPLKEVNKYECS